SSAVATSCRRTRARILPRWWPPSSRPRRLLEADRVDDAVGLVGLLGELILQGPPAVRRAGVVDRDRDSEAQPAVVVEVRRRRRVGAGLDGAGGRVEAG